ncbi:MAG: CPBP family intramembrane metalloprotease [Acidobacteria bacterium]|nr:CPBP family intramembrane metalloprotease [Acidobacteriota bacterium]
MRDAKRECSLRYNSFLPPKYQIGPVAAFAVWTALTLAGVLYSASLGYGGRTFAATLTAFSIYFATAILFAARGVLEFVLARFRDAAGYFLGVAAILAYLTYAIGTNSFALSRVAAILALIFVPLALAAMARRRSPGGWQDYVTIAAVWTAVKFWPSHWFWPFPGGRLAYVFTVLLCVTVAIAAFLLVRRFAGTGYNIGWGPRWPIYTLGSFFVFAAISIPLGMAMHFVAFGPRWGEWKTLPLLTLAILCFTAWPEEFLFRGLLQNMLQRTMKNEVFGWVIASILFGFSHITNMEFPNWRYVILASIAGMFYGWTWRKTQSMFASAIVHALVDALWHFLFRTL